jgi:hypothetical protein
LLLENKPPKRAAQESPAGNRLESAWNGFVSAAYGEPGVGGKTATTVFVEACGIAGRSTSDFLTDNASVPRRLPRIEASEGLKVAQRGVTEAGLRPIQIRKNYWKAGKPVRTASCGAALLAWH